MGLFFKAGMEPVIPLHLKHHPLSDKISEIFSQYWHGIWARENYDHSILNYWQRQPEDHLPYRLDITTYVFEKQQSVFKFNAGLSFILVNTGTDMMRFYHASYNTADIFEHPALIRNQCDWERALDIIYGSDLLEKAKETTREVYNIFIFCFIFDSVIKISYAFLVMDLLFF